MAAILDPEVEEARKRVEGDAGDAGDESGQSLESDQGGEEGGEGAEREGPGEILDEDKGRETPPWQAAIDELRQQNERLGRSNAELHDTLARMSHVDRTPEREEEPPDPQKDFIGYLDWRDRRRDRSFQELVDRRANAAASEQRARGIYSVESMGRGRGYDDLVMRHVDPIERLDPAMGRFLSSQRDPAAAKYALAIALEMIERFGGDTVKGFRNFWAAMDGKAATTKEVLSKIKEGAEKQVGRSNLRGSRGGSPPRRGPITEDEIKRMSVEQFTKDPRFNRLISG